MNTIKPAEREGSMKYILVTGAYGGMGWAAVKALADKGFCIFALDKKIGVAEEHVIPLEADISQLVPGRYCLTPVLYGVNEYGAWQFFDHLEQAVTFKVETSPGFNENMAVVPKNIDTGLDYINKACVINNQYCANLADIYISGEDVFQNYNQAVKYYETAISYYKNLCGTYDENNNACRNIDIIKAKFSVN